MIARLADLLVDRRPRERWLLFALVAVILPLGYWTLVLAPLAQQTRALTEDRAEAQNLLRWLDDQAAQVDLEALKTAPGATSSAPPAAAEIEQSLTDAGLDEALSRLATQPEGRIALGFDAVVFVTAMEWLSDGRPQGLRLIDLRVERTDDPGLVRLDAVLGPKP